jgi:hypothetical protein
MDMFDSLPIMLETVKEEPEFLSTHEEIKIPSLFIEMWPYVNLSMPVEIFIDLPKSMKEKMPSPKPKIVVAKPIEEETLEEHSPMEKFEQPIQVCVFYDGI